MDNNIKEISIGNKDFPWFLSVMDDAPDKLYYIGNFDLLKQRAVAIVGARKCSEYGIQIATKISKTLVYNDVAVVSGMAAGIDSAAHRAAINQKGKTIAVLGCGVDVCYPRTSMDLYKKICSDGLVISEYPPGTEPKPWYFPMRNRIISAISEAVVVVEAGEKSGSLITALKAAEQGKEIFAVPGNINNEYSIGTNKLIQDGARIVTEAEDIIKGIGIVPGAYIKEEINMGKDERQIYDVLMRKGEITLDEICVELVKSPTQINGVLAIMEIKGIISYRLGKIFIAKF